ncbi:M28 family metallopeptidase [Oryzobacter telluris]|uniref:M28 family metallopeptidase n=1 Tax=Oryzobacter telluris TaxID=3149179 RepID=UPI00370D4C08
MERSALLPPRRRTTGLAAVAALALSTLPVGAAVAATSAQGCESRANITYDKLLECVTVDGVLAHEKALQAIADANGGNRAAGLPGYDASVDYVVDTLKAAGWQVRTETFPFTYVGPSILRQNSPVQANYANNPATGTGYGDVTAAVQAVDLKLGLGNASTSGCEAADFAGFVAGNIALVQRGTCPFADKALNAEAAGASAVVIMNQGNTAAPDRNDAVNPTLGGADVVDIPVVGTSYLSGVALSQAGSTARVFVPQPESRPQENVIAELKGVNDDNVVMAGAHLDSVQAGPGINDNGSGSSALLELAENVRKLKPQNTIRLAWWGAEESGLIGSTQYVAGLSQAEKDRIALYLNFDMVGSPNYIFMIYDGNESSWAAPAGVPIPEGSKQIEGLFESLYTKKGVPYDDAQFSGRSDYQAFINNGIPAGGLFTGAEVVKTAQQAQIWGGTAGQSYDPCYHQTCDDIDNLALDALDVNSDVISAAVLTYAYSTESVNGVKGTKVPGSYTLPAPAGPRKTVNLPGGGGLAHDHDHVGDVS